MRARWKIVGLAGIAGVAASGVVIARTRRTQRDYAPDELRERLHRRLREASPTSGDGLATQTDDATTDGGGRESALGSGTGALSSGYRALRRRR
jgi:hypothetical protein